MVHALQPHLQVTYQEFRHFARLYQHVHSLAVALNFYHNIKGELERSDFKRATKIVTGSEIADELVGSLKVSKILELHPDDMPNIQNEQLAILQVF